MRKLAALVAVAAGFAGIAQAATAATADPQFSSNWAGYVASGTSFDSVSGTWVAPALSCTPGQSGYSSFWVGLGGSSQQSGGLEQIGTDGNCDMSGQPSSSAWYELIPAPPVPIPLTITPGDAISASVAIAGTTVSFQLTDATTQQSFSKEVTLPSVDASSAEWIAEAPSSCSRSACRPLPLANFGTVSFSAAAATAGGHAGPISDPAWTTTPVHLQPSGNVVRFGGFRRSTGVGGSATTGALSPDGSSFSVAWQAPRAVPATPRRRTLPWWFGPR